MNRKWHKEKRNLDTRGVRVWGVVVLIFSLLNILGTLHWFRILSFLQKDLTLFFKPRFLVGIIYFLILCGILFFFFPF